MYEILLVIKDGAVQNKLIKRMRRCSGMAGVIVVNVLRFSDHLLFGDEGRLVAHLAKTGLDVSDVYIDEVLAASVAVQKIIDI